MKAARLIHTTVKGTDQVFTTSNYYHLLSSNNAAKAANTKGSNLYADEYAISQTSAIPDYEEETGRLFTKSDTVIIKFEPEELLKLLTTNEVNALLQRASGTLTGRILSFQSKNGFELKQPLPDVVI